MTTTVDHPGRTDGGVRTVVCSCERRGGKKKARLTVLQAPKTEDGVASIRIVQLGV